MTKLPLDGLRVTDFSWVINGPQIAQWLGAMGAEVIKVESQINPDLTRTAGAALSGSSINGSGAYHYLNYAKKSVNINLQTDKGKQLAYEVVKRSDLVLECYPAPLAEKLGISYEKLKAVKEDIILISVSLLGKFGLEQSQWTGWGPMAAAYVGMLDAQAYRGGPPRQTGGTWPDYAVGTAVIFYTLAALRRRNRTGKGEWIDASMGDTVMGEMPEWYMDYFLNQRDRHQWENRDDVMAPHNTYRCKGDDKWIAIAVRTDAEWTSLCAVMGDPAWTRDAKFTGQFNRWKNRDELDRLLTQWTREQDHIEAAKRLQEAGVPAGAVFGADELAEDPQLWEWGYWWKMTHHESGERIMPGIPVKMSNVPEYNYLLPPDLGEHNKEVFCGMLGMTEDQVRSLMEEKVIY